MRLVVIGANAAGLSAASRARRIDRDLEIVVFEKGSEISYASCGLPYYVEGRVHSLDELKVYTPEFFARERDIAIHTRTEVTAIRHHRREVYVAGGRGVPYDRLVIATGARAVRTGIRGADLPHVFFLQTLADAERLRKFLVERRPRRGVVVGAGYIGLEAVDALRAHGLRVSLIEAGGGMLGRDDATLLDTVAPWLNRFGVEFRPRTKVISIEPDRVNEIPADLVVVAAGFRPNAELAADAGVELGPTGAIRTNEQLETNLHDVFAAGDCAETVHRITGRPAYIPLGTTANKMGRIAGANAAGRRERFRGVVGTSIVRVCGLGIGLTGLSPARARHEGFDSVSTAVSALERPPYFWGTKTTVELTVERRSGRLLGGAVIGERGVAGRINVLATALAGRLSLDEIEQLDLSYAPPYARVWDPLLIAAQQLLKLLN